MRGAGPRGRLYHRLSTRLPTRPGEPFSGVASSKGWWRVLGHQATRLSTAPRSWLGQGPPSGVTPPVRPCPIGPGGVNVLQKDQVPQHDRRGGRSADTEFAHAGWPTGLKRAREGTAKSGYPFRPTPTVTSTQFPRLEPAQCPG